MCRYVSGFNTLINVPDLLAQPLKRRITAGVERGVCAVKRIFDTSHQTAGERHQRMRLSQVILLVVLVPQWLDNAKYTTLYNVGPG